jgi:hypothetical protein
MPKTRKIISRIYQTLAYVIFAMVMVSCAGISKDRNLQQANQAHQLNLEYALERAMERR